MIALPEKPWEEGATFTNDETKVTYTFDGEKWLASGGEEADLSGFATKTFADEVDRTSQMRDEALDSKVDVESAKNTAVHLRLEDQILRCYAWSEGDNEKLEAKLTKVDEDLQKQIDAIEIPETESSSPMSAKLNAGFQLWSEGRLAEGCFNLLDEDQIATSKIKSARFLTFHIIQGWDDCEWMSYALRGKGQIHLMDVDGKYQMSKFVLGAEKHDAATGTHPAGALWFFELEEYGFNPDMTLSGIYFIEFDSCLEVK
tara:strand:- start:354 stop:1127 length:774 start_codon:yes stop_codon:yes gene_type:complete